MVQVRRIILVTLAMALAAGVQLGAQQTAQQPFESQFFVSVNGGVQNGSQQTSDRSTFQLYGEQGTVDVGYDIDRTGGLFAISGGLLVFDRLGVAVGYSRVAATSASQLVVTTPHPVFFNRPRTTTQTVDLKHTENMLHLMGVYIIQVAPKWDVAVSAGPSRLALDQEVVLQATPSDTAPPFDTIDNLDVRVEELTKIGLGFNVGADVTYLFRPNYGAGFFVRYVGGAHDFPLIGGDTSIEVGGFQIGGGLRLRF